MLILVEVLVLVVAAEYSYAISIVHLLSFESLDSWPKIATKVRHKG